MTAMGHHAGVELVAGAVIGALVTFAILRHRHQPTSLAAAAQPESGLVVVPNDRLPRFADVGGLHAVKAEIHDTLGLVLRDVEAAKAYRVTWNGVLLHGPPGTGKSFFARAVAGELGCNLIELDPGDLVTRVVGDGPRRVANAFATAAANLPCVLLFDELDAIACERGDQPENTNADILTQLLQSVEDWRREPRLIVMATTNELEALDTAVIRAGRFDRHVRIDLPDVAGRAAIFAASLLNRPTRADIDVDALARRTVGWTPASLVNTVELASLAALRERLGTDSVVQISHDHLEEALEQRGGKDRPTVERWSWDRLVLDPAVVAELRQIQELMEDPDQCERYGIDPPSGLLLTGPPGTGKTTVAKVLAAEAACSFYPVTAADLTSRWLGESEKAVARLFRRARDNAPSIIFIDEIDALGGARGKLGTYDRQLDQLLLEIDGMATTPGVLVVGATNRPQSVDPALRRGGRLSRTIELPLPTLDQRRRILELHTGAMPLHDVDLDDLAEQTDGYSGADLRALLQQAALESMVRLDGSGDDAAAITPDDIAKALSR